MPLPELQGPRPEDLGRAQGRSRLPDHRLLRLARASSPTSTRARYPSEDKLVEDIERYAALSVVVSRGPRPGRGRRRARAAAAGVLRGAGRDARRGPRRPRRRGAPPGGASRAAPWSAPAGCCCDGELRPLGRMAVEAGLRAARASERSCSRPPSARRVRAGADACDTPRAGGRREPLRAGRLRAARRALPRGGHRAREDGEVPELRIDPLSGLRVIVAGERGERPGRLAAGRGAARRSTPSATRSPRGTRTETPPEVYAAARRTAAPPDGPGWRVRVVPNLYPALSGADEPGARPARGRAAARWTCSRSGRRRAPTRW